MLGLDRARCHDDALERCADDPHGVADLRLGTTVAGGDQRRDGQYARDCDQQRAARLPR